MANLPTNYGLSKLPKLNLTKYQDTKKAPSQYDPAKQVEGYKKRLEASGLDPEKATDTRNWLERTLNLTPDQNFFFDIFEILERPQQALFNAWKAKQEGKDVKEALKAGISGNSVVRFKEILHNYGMDDSADKFGVDDIAGFLGDVLLDPIDLPMIAATGGTSAIAKADDAFRAANKTLDAAKLAGKADDIKDATLAVAKAQKKLKSVEKTRLISPIEGIFRVSKKGIGGGLKLTDKGITALLNKIDDLSAAGIAVGDAKKSLELAENYIDIKKRVNQIFNMAKEIPSGIMNTYRRNHGKSAWTKAELNVLQQYFNTKVDDFAKTIGMSSDETGELLMSLYEQKFYKPEITFKDMFLKGELKEMALDDDTVEKITKFLDQYLPNKYPTGTLDKAAKTLQLSDGAGLFETTTRKGVNIHYMKEAYVDQIKEDLIKIYKKDFPDEYLTGLINPNDAVSEVVYTPTPLTEILDAKLNAPRFYTQEQIERMAKYANDVPTNQMLDEIKTLMDDMTFRIDEAFDTALLKGTPEGYLKHSITKNRQNLLNNKKLKFEPFESTQLKGNIHEFSGRKYKMSAEEANFIFQDKVERYLQNANIPQHKRDFWESNKGMKLFETTINSSIDDFIENAPEFAKSIKNIDDVLLGSTFLDKNILKGVMPDEKVGTTYQKIQKTDLVKKLKEFSKYVPDETKSSFKDFIKGLPDTQVLAMDKTVFEMIGRLGNQKEISQILRLLDVVNNTFKKFKLLSPGFHMRNFSGNVSNMYLAGVGVDDIVKEYAYANKVFKEAPGLLKKATVEGVETLTTEQRKIYDLYKEFVENGFHDISREVWDIDKITRVKGLEGKKGVVQSITDFNANLNQLADERFRMAAMNFASKNPEVYTKLGLESKYDFVRRALFDPRDLSGVEKDVYKRLVPFYTFTKKNLAFQMQNIFDNPRKYNHLRKTIRSTWDAFSDIDVNDIEQYKKDNFWIPVPGMTKDGKYSAIKLNLPMGDLAEFLEDPGKKILGSMSPAIRTPFELATNEQIYTGMPVQEFEGQRGRLMPFLPPEIQPRKLEYLASQTGLDVPGSLLSDIGMTAYKGATGQLQGQSFGETLRQATGRSIFSEGSVENAQRSKTYQELETIRQLMKYYKQENIDILTLSEAENNRIKSTSQLGARIRALLN